MSAASRLNRLSPAPTRPISWAAMFVAAARSEAMPVDASPYSWISAALSGEGDDDEIAQLRRRAQVPFLAVVVSDETERAGAAQDRGNANVTTDEHGGHGVTGFVHGDATAFVGLVADVLGETDVDDHLRLDEVFDAQRPYARSAGR